MNNIPTYAVPVNLSISSKKYGRRTRRAFLHLGKRSPYHLSSVRERIGESEVVIKSQFLIGDHIPIEGRLDSSNARILNKKIAAQFSMNFGAKFKEIATKLKNK